MHNTVLPHPFKPEIDIAVSGFFISAFAGHIPALGREVSEIEGSAAAAVQRTEETRVPHPVSRQLCQQSLTVHTGDDCPGQSLSPRRCIAHVSVDGMTAGSCLRVDEPAALPIPYRCPFRRKSIGRTDGSHQGRAVRLIIGTHNLLRKRLPGLYILPVSRITSAAEIPAELGVQISADCFQLFL